MKPAAAPSRATLVAAMVAAVTTFGADDALIEQIEGGDVPTFDTIAARLGVEVASLIETFQQEVFEATGDVLAVSHEVTH